MLGCRGPHKGPRGLSWEFCDGTTHTYKTPSIIYRYWWWLELYIGIGNEGGYRNYNIKWILFPVVRNCIYYSYFQHPKFCLFWIVKSLYAGTIKPDQEPTSTQSLCRLMARWPAPAGFSLRVHHHPSIILSSSVWSSGPAFRYCRYSDYNKKTEHDCR